MSRSKKLPVIKDGPRNEKKGASYWRAIRRVTKNKVRYLNEELEEEALPDPKEIVDDYDYSDYTFDMRFPNSSTHKNDDETWKEDVKKYTRK